MTAEIPPATIGLQLFPGKTRKPSNQSASSSADGVAVRVADVQLDTSLGPNGTLARECPRYVELMSRALAIKSGEGFADVRALAPERCACNHAHAHAPLPAQIEALDLFRVPKIRDNGGRAVFVFLPAHLPEDDDEVLERATLYAFACMHQLVAVERREYTALWLCNNRETPSALSHRWFLRVYHATPYCYQTQLKTLAVVHPTVSVRVKLFALSYLHSACLTRHQFWEKLDFCDRLEFLDQLVPIKLIKTLPQEVKDHDKHLDATMYDELQNPHLLEQMGAAGMGHLYDGGGAYGFRSPGEPRAEDFGRGANSSDDEGMRRREKPPLPKRNWEMDD